ncbi:MAG: hypothetical protein NZ482_08010 [Gloeomargarita sp. SKYG98]|nr:hypothetical protein [Gloeomargarita sp. SKYG98]
MQESADCRRYKVQRLVDAGLETLHQALTDERVPLVTAAKSPSLADDTRPVIDQATLEVYRLPPSPKVTNGGSKVLEDAGWKSLTRQPSPDRRDDFPLALG